MTVHDFPDRRLDVRTVGERSALRILFVDDDARLLEGMRRAIFDTGWESLLANGVEEALEVVRSLAVDVIVSDVNMPVLDGFDLLAALGSAARTGEIPVIMVTGMDDEELKERALDEGATDLLTKPVRRGDLIARIRNAIRLSSSVRRISDQNAILESAVRERTRALAESRMDIIWCLARASEKRDGVTGRHVVRVAANAALIARAMGMQGDFVDLITLASPLHDVGKIGIPDRVLNKPGQLSAEERRIMQQHCQIGASILNPDAASSRLFGVWSDDHDVTALSSLSNPLLVMASTIAECHHERWDGAGYPVGLRGESIPLAARIVSLADVYDALRSARSYKSAYAESEALDIIRNEVGRQFDPAVYEAFETCLAEIGATFERLSDSLDRATRRVA